MKDEKEHFSKIEELFDDLSDLELKIENIESTSKGIQIPEDSKRLLSPLIGRRDQLVTGLMEACKSIIRITTSEFH